MKALVLFGSKSDEYIYKPLIEKLGQFTQVSFDVISAHRDPDKLEVRLAQKNYDVIVAGAGLAAHLPGVIASKVDVPVFGIPVEAVFGGLDALMSIQQMPYGIPVATCAPGKSVSIVNFLKEYKEQPNCFFKKIHLVLADSVRDYEYVTAELKRTYELAEQKTIELSQSNKPQANCFNIHMVTEKCEVSTAPLSFNVPLLDKAFKENPYKATELYDWVMEGGLWVGTNNTRNALLFSLKLSNKGDA